MFYRYDKNTYILIEKSSAALTGDNVCISDIDFDIDLYDIYVGLLDDKSNLTYHTLRAKPAEILAKQITDLKQKLESTQLDKLNTDINTEYRLSVLELGL